MKLQVLTYSDQFNVMRGEVWTAMPLTPIPVVETRTLGLDDRVSFVVMQGVKAQGRTKKEAVKNLKELVLASVKRLDNAAVEEIDF